MSRARIAGGVAAGAAALAFVFLSYQASQGRLSLGAIGLIYALPAAGAAAALLAPERGLARAALVAASLLFWIQNVMAFVMFYLPGHSDMSPLATAAMLLELLVLPAFLAWALAPSRRATTLAARVLAALVGLGSLATGGMAFAELVEPSFLPYVVVGLTRPVALLCVASALPRLD